MEVELTTQEILPQRVSAARPTLVHELVDVQAALTPSAPALRFRGETLSYSELSTRSSLLARSLRSLGVGPETLVGVCLERSFDLVVAVLGVLKAAGGYVPLDLDYPPERIAYILADAGARIVLTQDYLVSRLPDHAGTTICLDDDWEILGAAESAGPLREARPDDIAYVIYTSGSTGRPKGVVVEHRSLANYVLFAAAAYEAHEGDGAPMQSPLGFDLSITELFVPLVCGRAVTLVPEEPAPVAELPRALSDADFSFVTLTPAHVDALARVLEPRDAASARRVILGGEQVYGEIVELWRRHAPEVIVVNEYGPTETTVGCAAYELRAGEVRPGPVPIGRGIAGAELYVLDEELRPVEPGVEGELYVGGPCLARGYHRLAAATAERFVPDAFGDAAGGRLYRTGDVVQELPSGDLVFLRRADDQVKLRGYRIELGEIEAQLARLASVRAAVVSLRDDDRDAELVAYVVPAYPDAPPAAADLSAALGRALPPWMVPTAFVVVPELPLTPSGKVDRAALPAPVRESAGLEPRTETERILAGIWAEALSVERVGVDVDFFELGGHSLSMARVVDRVGDVFGVELPLVTLFGASEIAQLAEVVDAAQGATDGPAESSTSADPAASSREGPAVTPASEQQRYFWFVQQLSPTDPMNVLMMLRTECALTHAEVAAAVRRVVARHTVLRSCLRTEGERLVQVELGPESVPVTELHVRDFAELERLASEEAQTGFDLANEPPAKCFVAACTGGETGIGLILHHAAVDGPSGRIVIQDLLAALEGTLDDRPPSPEYSEYARWQIEEHDPGPAIHFWADLLEESGILDGPVRAGDAALAPAVYEELDAGALVARAGARAAQARVLSAAALIASFVRTIGRDSSPFLLGLVAANRSRVGFESVVGSFVRLLPFPARVLEGESLADTTARIHRELAAALEHQEFPVDELAAELARRGLSFSLPRITLNVSAEKAFPATLRGRGLWGYFREFRSPSAFGDLHVIVAVPASDGRWTAAIEISAEGDYAHLEPRELLRRWSQEVRRSE